MTAHPQWQVARRDVARRLAAQSRGLRHFARDAWSARITLARLTAPLRSPLVGTASTAALSTEPDLGAGLVGAVGAAAVRDDTLPIAWAPAGRRATGTETWVTPGRALARTASPGPRDASSRALGSSDKAPVVSAARKKPPGPTAKPVAVAPAKFAKGQTAKSQTPVPRRGIPKRGRKPSTIAAGVGVGRKKERAGTGISAAGASAQLKRRALRNGLAPAWTDQKVGRQKQFPVVEPDKRGAHADAAMPGTGTTSKRAADKLKVDEAVAQAKLRATPGTAIHALAVRAERLLAHGSGESTNRGSAAQDNDARMVQQPLQVPAPTTPSLPTPIAPAASSAPPTQQRRSGLRGLADLAGSALDADGAGATVLRLGDPSPAPQFSVAELTRVITEEARRAGLDVDEVGP